MRLTVEEGTTYKIEIDPEVLIAEFHGEWQDFISSGPGEGEVTDKTKEAFVIDSLEIMGVQEFLAWAESYKDYNSFAVTVG